MARWRKARDADKDVSQTSAADAGAYYYASGERIPLVRAGDLLAVDLREAGRSKDVVRSLGKAITGAKPLMAGMGLVDVKGLDEAVVETVRLSGLAQPVYQTEGATIVVLPEVRVEESRGKKERDSIRTWLSEHGTTLEFEENEDRFTIRPRSGQGDDALRLANQIVEQLAPEMAQARFIRVVKRPSTAAPPGAAD